MQKQKEYDAIIVGAGPAGLSAAIQLVRMGRDVLVLERKEPGGLLRNANLVENYPGFPNGITGIEFADNIIEQASNVGVVIEQADVTGILSESTGFFLSAGDRAWRGKTLVLATGTRPKEVSLKGADSLAKGTLLYEVADLPDNMGADGAVIIGGGDAAFDYALNIVSRKGKAIVCCRGEDPAALGLLVERAEKANNLDVHISTSVVSVEDAEGEVLVETSKGDNFLVQYLIIACGREAEDGLLPKKLPHGMFAIGDLVNGMRRQTAIAAGDGLRAAMDIDNLLKESAP